MDIDCLDTGGLCSVNCTADFIGSPNIYYLHNNPEFARCGLCRCRLLDGLFVCWLAQQHHSPSRWQQLMQKSQALQIKLPAKSNNAAQIASWTSKALDQASFLEKFGNCNDRNILCS